MVASSPAKLTSVTFHYLFWGILVFSFLARVGIPIVFDPTGLILRMHVARMTWGVLVLIGLYKIKSTNNQYLTLEYKRGPTCCS